jgi:hypothetical protein
MKYQKNPFGRTRLQWKAKLLSNVSTIGQCVKKDSNPRPKCNTILTLCHENANNEGKGRGANPNFDLG